MKNKKKTPSGCDDREGAYKGNAYKNNLINRLGRKQGKFDRKLLPSPLAILNLVGMKPGKTNPAGYWILRCPFHKNGQEKHPSLNLHSQNGHYRCHSCGAKGDILAFYMALTGKTFLESVKSLGAWGDAQ